MSETSNNSGEINLAGEIPNDHAGMRLDQALAALLPDFSRSRIKQWIESGELTLNGRPARPRDKLVGGEQYRLQAELGLEVPARPQPIALDIVFEDEHLLVIDKQAGLVVHPGAGNPDNTLQNALLHHCAGLVHLPRAGIVHRLDKDTTGLLVVAKTLAAHTALVADLSDRRVSREYEAICVGVMTAGGTVDEPIARHPVDRKRMAVKAIGGRESVTHYRVIARFRAHTHVAVKLETGRTHQIRVHMAHIRYPLVGDAVYGRRIILPPRADEATRKTLQGFRRQALHARRLGFAHPVTGETLSFEAGLPADMQNLIAVLAADATAHRE